MEMQKPKTNQCNLENQQKTGGLTLSHIKLFQTYSIALALGKNRSME